MTIIFFAEVAEGMGYKRKARKNIKEWRSRRVVSAKKHREPNPALNLFAFRQDTEPSPDWIQNFFEKTSVKVLTFTDVFSIIGKL